MIVFSSLWRYNNLTMLAKLILLFILVPVVELYLLIKVGQFLGAWNTILLVIITGVLGAALAKMEGMRVLTSMQQDMAKAQMPTDKIIDGVLVLIGGLLLLTPGILTDILGLSLIIPFFRTLLREPIKKKFMASFNKKGSTTNNSRTHVKVIDISNND